MALFGSDEMIQFLTVKWRRVKEMGQRQNKLRSQGFMRATTARESDPQKRAGPRGRFSDSDWLRRSATRVSSSVNSASLRLCIVIFLSNEESGSRQERIREDKLHAQGFRIFREPVDAAISRIPVLHRT